MSVLPPDAADDEVAPAPLLNDGGGGGVAPPLGVVGIRVGDVGVFVVFLVFVSSIRRGTETASASVPSAS